MAKPYAAVLFIGQDTYSEIPRNWLQNYNDPEGTKTKCQWPPSFSKNLPQLLKQRADPKDDWPIHEVEILRYCDTLAAARKAAEDSECESTTEQVLGRGLRLKRLTAAAAAAAAAAKSKNNVVFDSSDDDNDDRTSKSVPQMPLMPVTPVIENQTKIPFAPKTLSSVHKMNEMNDFQSMQENFEDESRTTGFKNDKSNENHVPSDLEIEEDDDNRFNVLNDKLSKCLRLLGAITVDLKDLKQRTAINNFGNACEVDNETALQMKKDLPLESRAEVNAFEEKLLNSPDYRRQFIRTINQIGGANGKDYTERVLDAIFSQSFATANTWEGKKTKYKVNKLNLINICEEIILKKFSTWDEAEFSKAGTNWFRLGNQRAGQQPKQVEKKNKPPNNNNTES